MMTLENWMKRRTQLQGWLAAASLFSTLAVVSRAHAEDPPDVSVHSTSETTAPIVKPSPNAMPLPQRFVLRAPAPLAPLHMPKSKYEEVRIWGLTIPTFVAYGLGGVSAGGAVATGIAAARGNDPETCVDTRCSEHGVRQRALWITTGVLTGMAVAGLSLGITLMVKAKTTSDSHPIAPRLDLGLSGQKAEAKIGWVFSSL
jgi:hypothetical protein